MSKFHLNFKFNFLKSSPNEDSEIITNNVAYHSII
jgi:hypothetical protein